MDGASVPRTARSPDPVGAVGAVKPAEAGLPQAAPSARMAYPDNLKIALVMGVIVAHVTMAWTGLGGWVFDEPPVGEPLRSLLLMASIVGVMFGMPLFFLVAGLFTPASLKRKGLPRFAVDRTVRLLVPVLFFVLVFSPPIEYVDPGNAGWSGGFWAFIPHMWRPFPPPPGPTWFLGVLLVFSLGYAVARTIAPRHRSGPAPLRARYLVVAALAVAVASYLLRLAVPLGEEVWHVTIAQAPAWTAGFTLGVLGGERGWFRSLEPGLARWVRWVAWTAIGASVAIIGPCRRPAGIGPRCPGVAVRAGGRAERTVVGTGPARASAQYMHIGTLPGAGRAARRPNEHRFAAPAMTPLGSTGRSAQANRSPSVHGSSRPLRNAGCGSPAMAPWNASATSAIQAACAGVPAVGSWPRLTGCEPVRDASHSTSAGPPARTTRHRVQDKTT